ncbi:MAG: hypothetical protein H8E98_00400 [Bacteroidetes bacterium]|nr:hypothetical protein [Bacteroidota bacterium]
MDIRLKRRIANDYPYPITVEFMRLNTMEYKNHGKERLEKIIDVTEAILQFLSLISISDLVENRLQNKITIPEQYRQRFRSNFTQTSLGKWVELLRETIKIFKSQNKGMYISELSDYFFKSSNSPTPEQDAFNRIVSIRNSIQHRDRHYSNADLEELSIESDSLLELILQNLEFLVNYQFLYVNKVTVKYHRWSEPMFDIDMSYIIGNNPDLFDSTEREHSPKKIIHTPAIIITKENSNEYLNLEPFVIYSDEGDMRISDIFMYMGWDKSMSQIKYKPVWKGGAFNLFKTSMKKVFTFEMLKVMELLGTQDDYLSFKKDVDFKLSHDMVLN